MKGNEYIMATQTTEHVTHYYTSLDYLLARYDAVSRQMGFRAVTLDEYRIWRTQLIAELRELTGINTMLHCDGAAQVTECIELGGYRRERVLLQTKPGVWMPLYVLIPVDMAPGEQRPAIIAPHGHSSAGKNAVAGRRDIPVLAEKIACSDYDYGVTMVREGFVVFCPDARGFGERREIEMQGDAPEKFLHSACTHLNHMAYGLGQTVTGMWTWDLMRLADYVETRKDCLPGKLGCAGLSGGGLQALWFAAMDERVQCAVVSGYFYGVRESLLEMNGNCCCNYVPHLWARADMGDIGALVAPRALFIETGDEDLLNGKSKLENVLPQVEIARGAYSLLGHEERLHHHIFPGPHKWHGKQAIPWLKKQLFGA